MKKILGIAAIAAAAIIPNALKAQATFPLPELQKLTEKNASDFETEMLTKDYSMQSKLSSPTNKVYTSDKKGAQGRPYTMSRAQVPNAAAVVTFTTSDKKYYLDLKNQLASSGFKFVNEENKTVNGTSAVCHNFTNKVYTVSLYTYTTDVMWFMVQVHH